MNHRRASVSEGGLRVLVIDDDRRVQAAMTVELIAVGWHPTVTGPDQLIEQDHTEIPVHFDVALVDVALPTVADGVAMITDLSTHIPVVAFSINGSTCDAALTAGAAAYLEKDGDTNRLLDALHTATTSRSHATGTGPTLPRSPR